MRRVLTLESVHSDELMGLTKKEEVSISLFIFLASNEIDVPEKYAIKSFPFHNIYIHVVSQTI